MRTKHVVLFNYSELSDDAKAKARDAWHDRNARNFDELELEDVIDDHAGDSGQGADGEQS